MSWKSGAASTAAACTGGGGFCAEAPGTTRIAPRRTTPETGHARTEPPCLSRSIALDAVCAESDVKKTVVGERAVAVGASHRPGVAATAAPRDPVSLSRDVPDFVRPALGLGVGPAGHRPAVDDLDRLVHQP